VRIGIEAPDAISIDCEEIRAARIKSGIKLGHGN
jgi:sRNA-binding carbon storage regulator CsrA